MKLPILYSHTHYSVRKLAREAYTIRQEGKCWHCKALLGGPPAKKIQGKAIQLSLFPKGFMNHPIHLHHDHKTDLTIGAVHARCNAVMWQYLGQ
jgi:hypothetical protein